jgi:hypothetical protein
MQTVGEETALDPLSSSVRQSRTYAISIRFNLGFVRWKWKFFAIFPAFGAAVANQLRFSGRPCSRGYPNNLLLRFINFCLAFAAEAARMLVSAKILMNLRLASDD